MAIDKIQAKPFRDVNLVVRVRYDKAVTTTVPYIKEASIDHKLAASVANSTFTIVLPSMSQHFDSALFSVYADSAYISSETVPYTPGTDTEEVITGERIFREFQVRDTVQIITFVVVDGRLTLGTPSAPITII